MEKEETKPFPKPTDRELLLKNYFSKNIKPAFTDKSVLSPKTEIKR